MNSARQKTRIALLATAVVTCTAMPAGAQTLDAVRDAVRTDPHAGETREERRNRERAAGDECDDDDSFFAEFLADVMFRPLGWLLFGDPGETELDTDACGRQRLITWYPLREWDGYFARYPYADGYDRFVMPEGHVPVPSRLWSGRLAFEYGDDFDRIDRWGGRFLLESRLGIGLDGEVNLYRERLRDGGHDRLAIGDLNLLYRVNESNRTQWRIGIGMNWLDDHDTDLGLNFTLRSDWQPGWPLVMSGEVDFGTLGHAWTFHGNASLGIMVRRCEFFVGYDYRTIESVELEGPMVGLRVWF